MDSNKLKEEIYYYVSKHENEVTSEFHERGIEDVRFTNFGNRAACKALYEVISSLPEDIQTNIVKLMKNKNI